MYQYHTHTYIYNYIYIHAYIYYICIYIYTFSPAFPATNDLNPANNLSQENDTGGDRSQDAWEAANHDVFRHGDRCPGRWCCTTWGDRWCDPRLIWRYSLVNVNIAIEHGHLWLIYPLKHFNNGDVPWFCSFTRGYQTSGDIWCIWLARSRQNSSGHRSHQRLRITSCGAFLASRKIPTYNYL